MRSCYIDYRSSLKRNPDADLGVFKQRCAVHSDDSTALDSSELPFFLRQSLCPWKINLYDTTRSNRRRDWKNDKNACFTDVTATANNKPVGFRYPNTDRPGHITPAVFTLLNHRLHNINLLKSTPSTINLIGYVNMDRLVELDKKIGFRRNVT